MRVTDEAFRPKTSTSLALPTDACLLPSATPAVSWKVAARRSNEEALDGAVRCTVGTVPRVGPTLAASTDAPTTAKAVTVRRGRGGILAPVDRELSSDERGRVAHDHDGVVSGVEGL